MLSSYIKYFPAGLFFAYVGKILFLGNASFIDASILLILGAVAFLYERYSQDDKIIKLSKELELLDTKFNDSTKVIEDIKSQMSAVKIANNMRVTKF